MVDFADLNIENLTRQRGSSRLSTSRMAPSRLEVDKSQLDLNAGKSAQRIVNIVAFSIINQFSIFPFDKNTKEELTLHLKKEKEKKLIKLQLYRR